MNEFVGKIAQNPQMKAGMFVCFYPFPRENKISLSTIAIYFPAMLIKYPGAEIGL